MAYIYYRDTVSSSKHVVEITGKQSTAFFSKGFQADHELKRNGALDPATVLCKMENLILFYKFIEVPHAPHGLPRECKFLPMAKTSRSSCFVCVI